MVVACTAVAASGEVAMEMFILQDGLLMECDARGHDMRAVQPINIVGTYVAAGLQVQRTSTVEAAVQSKLFSINGIKFLHLLSMEQVIYTP